jgi:hypothetical protein
MFTSQKLAQPTGCQEVVYDGFVYLDTSDAKNASIAIACETAVLTARTKLVGPFTVETLRFALDLLIPVYLISSRLPKRSKNSGKILSRRRAARKLFLPEITADELAETLDKHESVLIFATSVPDLGPPYTIIGGDRGPQPVASKLEQALAGGLTNRYFVDGSVPSDFPEDAVPFGFSAHAERGEGVPGLYEAFDHRIKPGVILLNGYAIFPNDAQTQQGLIGSLVRVLPLNVLSTNSTYKEAMAAHFEAEYKDVNEGLVAVTKHAGAGGSTVALKYPSTLIDVDVILNNATLFQMAWMDEARDNALAADNEMVQAAHWKILSAMQRAVIQNYIMALPDHRVRVLIVHGPSMLPPGVPIIGAYHIADDDEFEKAIHKRSIRQRDIARMNRAEAMLRENSVGLTYNDIDDFFDGVVAEVD